MKGDGTFWWPWELSDSAGIWYLDVLRPGTLGV